MVPQKRMSPLTALVLGVSGVLAVAIASASAVVVYGLHVAGGNAEAIVKFAENTVEGLPELLDALPPAVSDILNDRRDPSYIDHIEVDAKFVPTEHAGRYVPALVVKNNGTEVVSLLSVRVAAVEKDGTARREWQELAATPFSLEDDDWRGPLMPGATRHIVMHRWRAVSADSADALVPDVEIGDLRVWCGERASNGSDSVASLH